ncbi:hypothetical protein Tco_1310483 [Tanacetum coccineum]
MGEQKSCREGCRIVKWSIRVAVGNEAVMSISVDDCIDLDGKERSILAKVKDLSVISELLKHMSSEGFDDVGLRYVGGRMGLVGFRLYGSKWKSQDSSVKRDIFWSSKMFSRFLFQMERCVWIAWWVFLALDHGLQRFIIEVWVVGGVSSVFTGHGCEGPVWIESLENEEHWMSIVKAKIRDDSVLYNDAVYLGFMEKNLEDDVFYGENYWSYFRVIVVNVTHDDNEGCYAVIAPEKTSIIWPHQHPPPG